MRLVRLATVLAVAGLAVSGCAVGIAGNPGNITGAGATINGSVFSNESGRTSYWVRYGKTTAYGSETSRQTIQIDDEDAHPVSVALSGLYPNATYHFRLCAQDAQEEAGPGCSPDQTFKTLNEDSVTGWVFYSCGSLPCYSFLYDYAAFSGPSGAGPHGSIQFEFFDSGSSGGVFGYDVVCLNVNGDRATVAGTAQFPTSEGRYWIQWIEDTNGDGPDRVHFQHPAQEPTACPTNSPVPPRPVGTGDIFVRDAQP